MKSSTKRFISSLVALAFLIVAFVVFFDIVQPAYGSLVVAKGNLAGENALLTSESSTIATVENLMSAYRSQSSAQSALGATLPIGPDLSNGIAQIYGLAANNAIAIQNVGVTISAPQGSAAQSQNAAASLLLRPTSTVAFTITANGSYEDFLNFLSGLESNVRIFDVKQLSIQQAVVPGSKPGASPDLYTYLVAVNTYYQASSN